MKISACPPKPWRRWARTLSNILLGLLFLHLASSPAFAQGSYVCADPPYIGPCLTHDYCDSGFHPGPCIGLDGCDNPGQFACIADIDDGDGPLCTCTPASGGCGIQTGIGCIPTDLGAATAFLFGIFAWIIGLIAIIIFIIGGYQVMIGGDDPDRLQEGRAKMTAAVTGLFFLLLFVALIRIIGVEILGIDALREVIKPW